MNKSIYSLAFALVLGATYAAAGNGNGPGQGDGSCVGNCPTEGTGGGTQTQENSQAQQQGQEQGQTQSQEVSNVNLNYNKSTADADASARSNSNSNSSATGGDSNVLTHVGVKTGPTSSRSSSYSEGGDGGDAYASGGTGGDSSSSSAVGDTSAQSGDSVSGAFNGGNSTGDVGVSIADNSSYSVKYEEASARAASVYSQVCQNGGSAQGFKGGFGVNNSDVLCDHLKTASVMREAYMFEMQYGSVQCVPEMEGEAVSQMAAEYSDLCMNEKAQHYYEAYHESMDDAIKLMDQVEEAGMIDKFMGYLVRPAALIGALIWLI